MAGFYAARESGPWSIYEQQEIQSSFPGRARWGDQFHRLPVSQDPGSWQNANTFQESDNLHSWHPEQSETEQWNLQPHGQVPFRSRSATNMNRYELFEKALVCGRKYPPSGKTYLAIYWLEFKELEGNLYSPLFENDEKEHAESYLLKHLQLQLAVTDKTRLVSITIMQNASPCYVCALNYREGLKDMARHSSGLTVTLVFSAFHWVRRQSCRHEGHRHKFIRIELHEKNTDGLRQLQYTKLTPLLLPARTSFFERYKLFSAIPLDSICKVQVTSETNHVARVPLSFLPRAYSRIHLRTGEY